MSKIYESLKDVVPVTFARPNGLTFNDEMEELEKFVADLERQAPRLRQAIQHAKQEAVSEARRVEHLAETFKIKIAAIEAQLRETEETVRGKDSSIKALEENLTGKIQDLESEVKGKEKLLEDREKHIHDLNSQVQVLTKGIKDMSSFFRQAEALAAFETQNIARVLQAGESTDEHAKTATAKIDSPKLTSNKTGAPQETVSREFFDRVTSELTQVIGPMAPLIVRDHVEAIGESMEKFPQTRVMEFLKIVSEEIPDKNRKDIFRERLAQSPAPLRRANLFDR